MIMKDDGISNSVRAMVGGHDKKNLDAIANAAKSGQINTEAQLYMAALYSNSEQLFRDVFQVLGKCFGAPKAAVMPYDYKLGAIIDKPMKIADINPLSAYMVHHRLDADPMRNQFFSKEDKGHKIELSVSSIVSVIVGAQKKVDRSLYKVTNAYYQKYVDEVAETAQRVICAAGKDASGRAIANKIREKFSEKFITNASETVLQIIGRGHEKIAVELVRELDKITKPHLRLKDVWRVKCLFDLIPQARTFIERICELAPDKILTVRDKFFTLDNPRNYRDAKIILNIGKNGTVIPVEIICQVRTFFEFENTNHCDYETTRKNAVKNSGLEKQISEFYEDGVKKYNLMICDCLNELFERVGWNILYNQGDDEESLFDGFPKISKPYYPAKLVDIIMNKLDNAVENEVFRVTTAPAKLTSAQELTIFRWMTKFILVSAMPYKTNNWTLPVKTVSEKLFNFIMKEVQRYYK